MLVYAWKIHFESSEGPPAYRVEALEQVLGSQLPSAVLHIHAPVELSVLATWRIDTRRPTMSRHVTAS